MQEYLLTHPSLFIITITIIVIMLIYIFRDKIKKNYMKVEDTCLESTCSIEMQTMATNIPDEPDLIAPLPNPKLYKKIRNDLRNPSPKYDIPRIHGIPETPEPSTSSSPPQKNNLEILEKKYNIVQPPSVPLINNFNCTNVSNTPEESVIHRVKSNKNTDNRVSVSDVHHGSYVSFDREFDEFDDLSRRSNVMRITLNFDPDEPPINV